MSYDNIRTPANWAASIAASARHCTWLHNNDPSTSSSTLADRDLGLLPEPRNLSYWLVKFSYEYVNTRLKDDEPLSSFRSRDKRLSKGTKETMIAWDSGVFVTKMVLHLIHFNGIYVASRVTELCLRYEGLEPNVLKAPLSGNSLKNWYDEMHSLDVTIADLPGRVEQLIKKHWCFRGVFDKDHYKASVDWAEANAPKWFEKISEDLVSLFSVNQKD